MWWRVILLAIAFKSNIIAKELDISIRTHNGTNHEPPFDPHNYTCETQLHHLWHKKHGNFYIIFFDQPCRFPECVETCRQNGAMVAYPETEEEYNFLMSLSNPLTGDTIIGFHLPIEIPIETVGSAISQVISLAHLVDSANLHQQTTNQLVNEPIRLYGLFWLHL